MGQPKRELDGVRGAPNNEAEMTAQFRSMPGCEVSQTWSRWAPGLKEAMSTAVSRRIQWLDRQHGSPRQPAIKTLSSAALESCAISTTICLPDGSDGIVSIV